MDTNQLEVKLPPSSWRLAIIFGIISGTTGILMNLVFIKMGVGKFAGQPLNYTPNIICFAAGVIVMCLAVKLRRDKGLGGYITMGQCAGLGLKIGLFAGLVTAVFMYYYFMVIDTSVVTKMVGAAKDIMVDVNTVTKQNDAEVMNKFDKIAGTNGSLLPRFLAVQLFGMSIVFNLIFSVIAGAFLRKDPPELF
jgi:hypothetical protein